MSQEPLATEPKQKPSLFSETFQAFRYRNFRLLWIGASTSTTGTWMQITAQSWFVLALTNSPFYLGLIGFLGQLPIILFTLIGGAFADRLDRRKILLVSQYVQMLVAVLLTILIATDRIEIWHFLVLVFVSGSGQAFGGPAYQALIPGLVKREDVSNAIALNSIQFNLARMIGPVISGLLYTAVGAALCFGLNAISFLAVIVTLYLIQTSFKPQKTDLSVLHQIREGFTYIRTKGDLWQLTVLGFVSTFCGVPLLTLLPVFARDIFELQATGYSIMMAISGAGSITGALIYATFSKRLRQGPFALRIQIVFAALLIIFALSRNLFFSCAVLFFTGICLISLFSSITSLVQLAIDEEMRGRMMSIFMLAFRGGMPLGDLTAGYLASTFSATTALVFMGLLLSGVALGFTLSGSGVRRL